MTVRRRNDSVKPGRGIDTTEGENFTKQYRTNPWTVIPQGILYRRPVRASIKIKLPRS
jgi:hypothetical protein